MSMINATNVVVMGGSFNINDPLTATELILRTFGKNYVPSATHDNNDIVDPPKCHPGTRTSFLTRLFNWVEDKKSAVYLTWLHGPAGAGKSAIARSLAESLDCNRMLAGSFFFFKADSRRNTEIPFAMTLAYQISRSIPDTLPHIAKAVRDDPTVFDKSLKTQFDRLIIEPLGQITANKSKSFRPMLIIVDGLDECVERHSRTLVLQLLFDAHQHLHGHIKFLVVSRPEYDIRCSFDSSPAALEHCINTINLQGDLQAYEDVRKYLRDKFCRIKKTHPLREHFTSDWPSDDAIERLVEKSSGHFIYASTVIKFIENNLDRPQERLDIIINLRSTSQNPYAALDALYLSILTSSRACHAMVVKILSIVVLDAHFNSHEGYLDGLSMRSVPFIETFLFLQCGAVQLALLDLKSLVGVKETVEFWHRSFSDFLLDSSRSNEFYTCSASAYTLIAKGCLCLLSDKTGLLERPSSDFCGSFPTRTLKCHHLLSVCCKRAVIDHDLQTAMMKYEFNVIPPRPSSDINPSSLYIWVLCSCLCNYQQSSAIFKGTNLVERLLHQFDHQLISELRSFIPPNSEIMNVLRATILLHRIDRESYKELVRKHLSHMADTKSCFLLYMYEWPTSHDGEAILHEFFYSKDRACEYYLGESPPELPSRKRKSSRLNPLPPKQSKKRRLH